MTRFIDMIGLRFGRLLVTEYSHRGENYRHFWRCQCDCGNAKIINGQSLRNGATVSCGCYHSEKIRELERKHEPLRNLTGDVFGNLTVESLSHVNDKHQYFWNCRCGCGNDIIVNGRYLREKSKTSCGCQKPKAHTKNRKAMLGLEFGRLTVVRYSHSNESYNQFWECLCRCGNLFVVDGASLRNGNTKSCGCLNKEGNPRHGHASRGGKKSRTYITWQHMLDRCYNNNFKYYSYYGGRGITVCDEWKSFDRFLKDFGEIPDGYTIDRIDNDLGYCKDNCRLATRKEQVMNRRNTVRMTLDGVTETMWTWSGILGIKVRTLRDRKNKGWSDEKILNTPVNRKSIKLVGV